MLGPSAQYFVYSRSVFRNNCHRSPTWFFVARSPPVSLRVTYVGQRIEHTTPRAIELSGIRVGEDVLFCVVSMCAEYMYMPLEFSKYEFLAYVAKRIILLA